MDNLLAKKNYKINNHDLIMKRISTPKLFTVYKDFKNFIILLFIFLIISLFFLLHFLPLYPIDYLYIYYTFSPIFPRENQLFYIFCY